MHGFYLMITSDGESVTGESIPARELIDWRLKLKRWPLYQRTPYRDRIALGDKLLFYMGGRYKGGQSIVAEATVAGLKVGSSLSQIDPSHSLTSPSKLELSLADVNTFAKPVPIRSLIGQLSIFPRQTKFWGTLVMAGCRKITAEDYRVVLQASQ